MTNQGQDNSAKARGRRISEIFAENVFSMHTLKEHVEKSTYDEMKGVILKQQRMDFATAEVTAQALIKWAMSKGVTHYTHWFHPLTDSSAEKHDAFFESSLDLEVKGIESLSASKLVQQEPDGSSLATKASPPPPYSACSGPTLGKVADPADPVT